MEILQKVLPIILIFVLGYVLKKTKLFGKEAADIFLKFIFYVSMPALVFKAVSALELNFKFTFLPIIAASVFFGIYFLSFFVGKKLKFPPKTFGTFILGTMIMNTGFALPFIYSAYGTEGIATITIFDFGNALFVFPFGYYIAMKYGKSGKNREKGKIDYKKLLLLPPVWGLVLGLAFNLLKIPVPIAAGNFFEQIGMLTLPLIMLSIGIYFTPRVKNWSRILIAIFIRSGLGLLLAFIFVTIFNLEGVMKAVVLVCAGSPVGYNALVFSTLEDLDKEFAANLVSFSILTGLIYVPILLFLVK